MMPLLGAWRVWLDPLPIDAYWLWLLLPLSLAISLVYKAIRLDDLSQLPRQVAVMTFQMVLYMGLCGGAIWLLLTRLG